MGQGLEDRAMKHKTQISLPSWCAVVGYNLKITGHFGGVGGEHSWTAKIDGVDVVDGQLLRGEYGRGATPEEAIDNYASLIQGKILYHRACEKHIHLDKVEFLPCASGQPAPLPLAT